MNSINQVEQLHTQLLQQYPGNFTIAEFLGQQAETLFTAHQQQNPAIYAQISNWYPPLTGATIETILAMPFSLSAAQFTIAREYGFTDWAQVEGLGQQQVDALFETAVTAITTGNLSQLQELLHHHPQLTQQASGYGHRATLLHYIAANGVETWRQKVPANAVDITRTLLDAGANVHAQAHVYGGQFDTLALLTSSTHPAAAGLTEAIAQLLHHSN